MFGIGFTEFLIILIFGFIILGPERMPKIAKTVGHAIGKFRAIQKEAKDSVSVKDFIDPDAEDPFEHSIQAAEKMKDLAVKNAKELKEDVSGVAKETKESVKEKKEVLAEKKAQYDKKKEESDSSKANDKLTKKVSES